MIGSTSRLLKPLLLVSDLDDTLVAHTTAAPGADAASAAFKAMWEGSRAAGINCKLAINTGRWATTIARIATTVYELSEPASCPCLCKGFEHARIALPLNTSVSVQWTSMHVHVACMLF